MWEGGAACKISISGNDDDDGLIGAWSLSRMLLRCSLSSWRAMSVDGMVVVIVFVRTTEQGGSESIKPTMGLTKRVESRTYSLEQ